MAPTRSLNSSTPRRSRSTSTNAEVKPSLDVSTQSPTQPRSAPNAHVFVAVYSNVPVYEMMVRGIGVMRRRSDNYMNATQILKVAGVDRTQRSKILENDITQSGPHEKIQGGYGRFQGTWIPIDRARTLAQEYNVLDNLLPLIEYEASTIASNGDATNNGGDEENQNQSESINGTAKSKPNTKATPNTQKRSRQDLSPTLDRAEKRTRLQHSTANGDTAANADVDMEVSPKIPTTTTTTNNNDDGNEENDMAVDVDDQNTQEQQQEQKDGHDQQESSDKDKQNEHENTNKTTNANDNDNAKEEKDNDLNSIANRTVSENPSLRRSTRYSTLYESANNPMLSETHRTVLMQIFMNDVDPSTTPVTEVIPSDVDLDTPIDENLHTPLHWAASLARVSLVESLINRGADIERGNKNGETPLSRSLLVTNCHQNSSFPHLLNLLAPSLRVIDDNHRTVLHQIALTAGVKGRSASSLYYLETILEYIARKENGNFKDLVDAQDINGDTALNIFARVGNRSMVRLLVDVGADRFVPNKLGLRACDFGLEEDLNISPGEEAIGLIKYEYPSSRGPNKNSQELVDQLTNVIEDLRNRFADELDEKNVTLESIRGTLRDATRNLAAQRREVQTIRSQCSEIEKAKQRVRNLQKAIAEEDHFDWKETPGTLQMKFSSAPVKPTLPPDFSVDPTITDFKKGLVDADSGVNRSEQETELLALRRMAKWYDRSNEMLTDRIEKTRGASTELQIRCQKIVAICCNVPIEEVDGMIDQLLVALESDGKSLDMSRVVAFIAKQRESTSSSTAAALNQ